ncbi:efflux RND transporter periplasmic adaptor subunit [Aeromonas simiae]|uniref:efflux RND transporter periplasmic adaptor subunit n=1 Tax=Aeromonas simiae TaxID=218936 RepID=UPI00266C2F84|nr:efflux RND transporter periplasmic adaptor subunit [Aeromonas simiae]MDO2949238.1 efflux RND transporter periplasmic adaptor subunit [Aeromonas simiae]MDO2952702.1 efflux RND transporter periplasmic adaptor subunit [Aeromonas simiae]MDO2956513.1 efflux RND transporter periplasmic adaptor subunit [Aeromonas simiae]
MSSQSFGPLRGLLLLAALAGSAAAGYWLAGGRAPAPAEKQPLYWVNPMDPSDKRPGPAKDSMGMDFLPVYEEKKEGSPGTVTISPEIQQNMGVRLAEVTLSPWRQRIETVGYVGYDEERLETVTPRMGGWIRRLHVKSEGQPVKAGQPLFDLYSPDLVNAQKEFLLALGSGNPAIERAAEGKLRALSIPAGQINELKRTRQVQQTIRIPAARGGYLVDLKVREGQYVEPADPLFSIASLGEVWVSAELFERQAGAVQVGMPATMTLDYDPGRHWPGRVDYLYPTLDAATRTLKVRLRFANPDGQLRPNMFAKISLERELPPVLQVPAEAVIRTGRQDRVVLALGDGRFKSVAVRLGARDGERQAILEGVEAGDKVVSSAQFLIDSESSLSSDFQRMTAFRPVAVWSEGTVTALDGDRVTLSHQAVPEWQWPAMEMEFGLGEGVDAGALKVGTHLHFEMRQQGEDYQVTAIHVMDDAAPAADNHGGH